MTLSKATKDGGDQLDARSSSIAGQDSQRRGSAQARSSRSVFPIFLRVRLDTNRTDGNLLDCSILDKDDNVIGTVVAARPPDLQADFYDGQTIGGVTYTLQNKDEREASDGSNPDETQLVTPDYVEGVSRLILCRVRSGTGLEDTDGTPVIWQDITPGRAWAVDDSGGGD